MKTHQTSHIRNVALLGSPGSGKTTLVEAMLYRAGVLNRIGSVESGSTVSDASPEEHETASSQVLSLVAFEWENHKVNLLDVPGSLDFAGEMAAALAAADLAIFVVDATAGVDHGLLNAWRKAAQIELPRMFFVNKLDREFVSFDQVLSGLRDNFGAGVAPLELPLGQGPDFHGIADLLTDQAWVYDSGQPQKADIPEDMQAQEQQVREALVEGIVVADDDLLESYLDGQIPDFATLETVLGKGVAGSSVFPVVCGSATVPIAVDRLCNYICEIGPSPEQRPDITVELGGSETTIQPDNNSEALLFVFKTINDPYLGTLSLFKALTGQIKPDAEFANLRTGNTERAKTLLTLQGSESLDLNEVAAGDIAVLAKLSDTQTADVLSGGPSTAKVSLLKLPRPMLSVGVVPRTRADEDKLSQALRRACEEDPTLLLERNDETQQTLLSGLGETHLRFSLKRIERKFSVGVDTTDLRVPYRETITRSATAEGKHKKQSGGHGQFGIASVRIEPLERGEGFEFLNEISGGVIPRQYIPAVEAGIAEAMSEGGQAGYPVVDMRAAVYDGKHHSVDSSEFSFKMAGKLAFQEALGAAGPVILEPMSDVEVVIPEECMGDVMGDLSSRRGVVQGTDSGAYNERIITAVVPTAELVRYAIDLRSITGGRGTFEATHSRYEVLPGGITPVTPPIGSEPQD